MIHSSWPEYLDWLVTQARPGEWWADRSELERFLTTGWDRNFIERYPCPPPPKEEILAIYTWFAAIHHFAPDVDDKTYGAISFPFYHLYLQTFTVEQHRLLEAGLVELGYIVDDTWWPRRPGVVKVQVAYHRDHERDKTPDGFDRPLVTQAPIIY